MKVALNLWTKGKIERVYVKNAETGEALPLFFFRKDDIERDGIRTSESGISGDAELAEKILAAVEAAHGMRNFNGLSMACQNAETMYYGAMKTKYKTAAAMKKALKSQVFDI